ncbi:DNA starvation/stationary phase protection protein [Paenibacillus validus]|uniref:DNA starvation/stationary phase protection protein n=1 Tax=Paenibacillus validus TaxID=44253 RepID=A0A7X2ZE00_9BACL|nr:MULTISPECIES: DNA starvation/stationary phase protection protein [Paenibacillus]MED4600906.1 DNA starvation/stationary phase protection protein [Paenibacillus validus]MED4607563.1 DNA starvation/stationary phase protection protein [Paenibacillus validus]MUG73185.1 DNA starvation/stationary phase protection protein [Paenibacillus validus]
MAKVMEKETVKETTGTTGNDLLALLNQQVANWAVLHIKLHQHHWFVKGPHFFDLHAKFEELYNEAGQTMDELAERILALQGSPVSTTKEISAAATVKEHAPLKSADEMVKSVRDDFKQLINEIGQAMEVAEKQKDDGTHDMLIGIRTTLEKHVWMLDAYIK